MGLRDILKKEQDRVMKTDYSEFIADILEVCGFAEHDGFYVDDIKRAAQSYSGDTLDLEKSLSVYYSRDNRVLSEYEPIVGYLACIGKDISYIKRKLEADAAR